MRMHCISIWTTTSLCFECFVPVFFSLPGCTSVRSGWLVRQSRRKKLGTSDGRRRRREGRSIQGPFAALLDWCDLAGQSIRVVANRKPGRRVGGDAKRGEICECAHLIALLCHSAPKGPLHFWSRPHSASCMVQSQAKNEFKIVIGRILQAISAFLNPAATEATLPLYSPPTPPPTEFWSPICSCYHGRVAACVFTVVSSAGTRLMFLRHLTHHTAALSLSPVTCHSTIASVLLYDDERWSPSPRFPGFFSPLSPRLSVEFGSEIDNQTTRTGRQWKCCCLCLSAWYTIKDTGE
ncbi:hypothetical protein B0J18DRAFT_199574 [Chaetomium sp. MPI-SDFR-AT-0129]|nr:hypothetical protein B0J18DRAFT_199574 [Chaetomium sp. MPI-SDFR-AT-0129]